MAVAGEEPVTSGGKERLQDKQNQMKTTTTIIPKS